MNSPRYGRLLLTADDACVTPGIDNAIRHLAKIGVVANAAAVCNWGRLSGFSALVDSGCRVGIHYNLSSGSPLSRRQLVPTLVDLYGNFRQPLDYVEVGDESLLDAVKRYAIRVLPHLTSGEVLEEVKAQRAALSEVPPEARGYDSFHHDLDRSASVFALLAQAEPPIRSRQVLLKEESLAGFDYLLVNRSESQDAYLARLKRAIRDALSLSASRDGVPFEMALHPSADADGLETFSLYRTERLREYRAWISLFEEGLFADAVREGAFFRFEMSSTIENLND